MNRGLEGNYDYKVLMKRKTVMMCDIGNHDCGDHSNKLKQINCKEKCCILYHMYYILYMNFHLITSGGCVALHTEIIKSASGALDQSKYPAESIATMVVTVIWVIMVVTMSVMLLLIRIISSN